MRFVNAEKSEPTLCLLHVFAFDFLSCVYFEKTWRRRGGGVYQGLQIDISMGISLSPHPHQHPRALIRLNEFIFGSFQATATSSTHFLANGSSSYGLRLKHLILCFNKFHLSMARALVTLIYYHSFGDTEGGWHRQRKQAKSA